MKPKNGLFITFGDIEQVECHILAPPLSWSLLEAVALSWGSPLAMLKTFRRQSCEECMRMFLERWLWQILGENIGGLLSSLDIRHGDDTFAVLFTHIMLTQLDMLVSAADYWIVHHGNTRFVVFEHQSWLWLLESGK